MIKIALYPKEYIFELSESQEEVLLAILEQLEKCRVRHTWHPRKCPTCGQEEICTFYDTWGMGGLSELDGKIHMLKAILGLQDLVIEHT